MSLCLPPRSTARLSYVCRIVPDLAHFERVIVTLGSNRYVLTIESVCAGPVEGVTGPAHICYWPSEVPDSRYA